MFMSLRAAVPRGRVLISRFLLQSPFLLLYSIMIVIKIRDGDSTFRIVR